jgi:hypothetical protein
MEANKLSDEFTYDIAFSFVAEDEAVATQINDLLRDRYKTFLYSEQQKALAGTDGELTFNAVFSTQTRIVAVLYRHAWGQTPWTRIEETAIRNRAHDHGYDFVTFIAMTDPITAPIWLPKTRILYGLQRFGIPGAATALDARIQEHGGKGADEDIASRAARLQRAKHLENEKDSFRRSEKGVNAAKDAYRRLLEDLNQEATKLRPMGFGLEMTNRGDYTALRGGIVVLVLRWEHIYANNLDGGKLNVDFFKGFPRLPGSSAYNNEAPTIERNQFTFGLAGLGRPAWFSKSKNEHSIAGMAAFILKRFMDHEEREQTKDTR